MTKKTEGTDVTPGQGEENGFFSDFFDGEGALEGEASEEITDEEEDEGTSPDDDAEGSDDDGSSDDEPTGSDEDNDDNDDAGSDEDEDSDDEGEDDAGDEEDDSDGQGGSDGSETVDYGSTMQSLAESGVLDIIDAEKEYTPDAEGLQELVQDTVNARLEAERQKAASSKDSRVTELEQFLSDNPEADLVEWAESQNEFDYNAVDHNDDEHAEYLLEDYLQLQGYPEDEARQTIEDYKKAKTIKRHALRAKQALVKYQEQQNTAKTQAREQARIQKEQAIAENKRNYEQRILKTDKIAGIDVTPKERQELADYIMKPVDEHGNTQLMLDEANNDQADLLYALIQKRKLDLSKLERKAQTKATIKLKKKLDKHTDKAAKARPNHAQSHGDATMEGQIDDSVLDTWNM